ncbi:MAG: pyridine nucleotide-disulfide oxidoreductase, partial [Pseudobdellovibrionaceae bacterium]
MSKTWLGRIAFLILLCAIIVAYKWFGLGHYLSLESLKTHQFAINSYYQSHSALVAGIFVLIYIASTSLSLPGATVLTLAAGAIFGLGLGTVLVSISSTIGATLAFLA